MSHKISVRMENSSGRNLPIIIEPSAEQYTIPKDKVFIISCTKENDEDNSEEDILHIEYGPDFVTVWQWENGKISLYMDGKIAEPWK